MNILRSEKIGGYLLIAAVLFLSFAPSCKSNSHTSPVVPASDLARKESPSNVASNILIADGLDVRDVSATAISEITGSEASQVFYNKKILPLTRTALILAGLKEEAEKAGARLPESDRWREYCLQINKSWKRWETDARANILSWADKELSSLSPHGQLIYYPFSGPDFLYVSILFPQADAYILTGLEPAGDISLGDEFQDPQYENLIESARRQFQNILGLTFFRRNDLKKTQDILSIVDMLLMFSARLGFDILDVSPIYIDKHAKVVPIYPGHTGKIDSRLIRGIRIYFCRPPETTPKTLYYFCADLSNSGMEKNLEYLEFLKKWPQPITFLKAASYLLQYKRFSKIRSHILERSIAVLQDDSGIAVDEFPSAQWTLSFFGNYVGPIDLFTEFYQADLKTSYLANPVKPLPFGIGYRFRPNESCLILATTMSVKQVSPPATLKKVTIGGIESYNVVIKGDKPEIVLSFSQPVNPDTIIFYLRSQSDSRLLGLDLRWDKNHQQAIGVSFFPLDHRGVYTVVLCSGAKDMKGNSVITPEDWSFRVLGLSAGDFEDKTILVDRESQQVFLCGKDGMIQKAYQCATGKYYPTAGTFRVIEKTPGAKSLFDDSTFSYFTVFQKSETGHNVGFHSIPVYPDGRLAGKLGQPNSHGCIRLSNDTAKELYDWAPIGTKVIVY